MIEKIINIFFEKCATKNTELITAIKNNRNSNSRFEHINAKEKTSLHEYFKTAKGLYLKYENDLEANLLRNRREFLKSADFYQ